MCGIAGLIDRTRSEAILAASVTRMTDSVLHRGPDAGDVWVDAAAGVALGHRRLSIVDLSPLGAQPMHDASGRYVMSYNGEIYNFLELREDLEGQGATFRGGSDTEVMLAAIAAWGIDAAVRRFIGMFAFALWDRERRELHLVRDRLGIKPLYFGQFGSLFAFGSELKALVAAGGWQPQVDRDALAAYARWNYVPAPKSIWHGVEKLPPGTRMVVRADGTTERHTFWDLRAIGAQGLRDPLSMSDREAEDALDTLLRDAVRRRMVADVPLGAFLSGGVDSSLVVALMQAQSDRPVRSFSMGFTVPEYDEAPFARTVAAHLKTEHTELYVAAESALDVIPRLPVYFDEPFADSSQIPTLMISELTRKHVTVALSGDGGDELFAGYTRYHWATMVERRFLGLPAGLRNGMATALEQTPGALWETAASLLPGRWRQVRVAERAAKLATFLRERDADGLYRRQHTHWPDPERAVPGGHEPRGVSYDASLAREVPDSLRRMQLLDMLTYLPDDILTKVDRASMAVALEARVPLLDHRVVELTWRLPRSMLVRDGIGKWLLRKVLYRYVPPAMIERPKRGFSVPMYSWLRGPLREWAESLLAPRRLQEAGFFDATLVRNTWRDLLEGRNRATEPLWGVLMFEAWRDSVAGHMVEASAPAPALAARIAR